MEDEVKGGKPSPAVEPVVSSDPSLASQPQSQVNAYDAIQLIQSDDDAYWCRQQARAATFKSEAGDWYCAVAMPKYQEPEEQVE